MGIAVILTLTAARHSALMVPVLFRADPAAELSGESDKADGADAEP